MTLTKYDYLNLIIRKMLRRFKRNIVLDEIENSKEYKSAVNALEKYLFNQVKSFATIQNIEFLFTMTRKADVNPQIQFYIEKELNRNEFGRQNLVNVMIRLLGISEVLSGQDALDTISVNQKYTLRNTAFIRQKANDLIPTLNQTTAKELSKKLEEAKAGFLTIDETIDFLLEYSRERVKQRAEITALNESSIVSNATQFDVYDKSGVVELRWVTSKDERVCPICKPLNNKVINVRGNFTSGGETLKYPPAHINCRCFVEPVEREALPVWNGR
jgi:SPP1 gp7 family putative phage head morphogenesis protein